MRIIGEVADDTANFERFFLVIVEDDGFANRVFVGEVFIGFTLGDDDGIGLFQRTTRAAIFPGKL